MSSASVEYDPNIVMLVPSLPSFTSNVCVPFPSTTVTVVTFPFLLSVKVGVSPLSPLSPLNRSELAAIYSGILILSCSLTVLMTSSPLRMIFCLAESSIPNNASSHCMRISAYSTATASPVSSPSRTGNFAIVVLNS